VEPIEPLAPDARELLAAYRRDRPGPHGRARNWPAVRSRLEPRAEPRHPFSFAWWFGGLALALAAVVLLLVHALFVAWQATRVASAAPPEASDAIVDAPAVVQSVTTTEVAPAVAPAPMPALAPQEPAPPLPLQRPRAATPAIDPAPQPDTSSDELVLVAAARTAIRDGEWKPALADLDEHARRFPSGVLAEERSALRAIVLCRSGAADARTAVLAFNSSYPGSHHHRSIKAACDQRTNPTPP
jgi:hypothetical protein